ncbi:SMI1/KNR4 family protein [Streptomyces sp. NPDC087270]|uniref:SMI1/KNR4 family protein n=1 Tax=Streptomyces sp. NPDC087270 TaxID=3365774 RepID=UPI0037F29718
MWVNALLSATGTTARGVDQPWAWIEEQLGTALPRDYKKACEAFGVGEFSASITLLCADETLVGDLLTLWSGLREGDADDGALFEPYRIHEPGISGGLIPWGSSRSSDLFFWQVDGEPDSWPVIASMEDADELDRYDMTTTQFLYRILTDPGFRPYTVAGAWPHPYFESI